MRIRWRSVLGYVALAAGGIAGHARGTTAGMIAEVVAFALSPFLPAVVTKKGESQQ